MLPTVIVRGRLTQRRSEQVAVRRPDSQCRAADGQQPTAVEINTAAGEPWRIVGWLGH
jgi:hypothetical protein